MADMKIAPRRPKRRLKGSESQHPLFKFQCQQAQRPLKACNLHERAAYVWGGVDQSNEPVVPICVWTVRITSLADSKVCWKGEVGPVRSSLIPSPER